MGCLSLSSAFKEGSFLPFTRFIMFLDCSHWPQRIGRVLISVTVLFQCRWKNARIQLKICHGFFSQFSKSRLPCSCCAGTSAVCTFRPGQNGTERLYFVLIWSTIKACHSRGRTNQWLRVWAESESVPFTVFRNINRLIWPYFGQKVIWPDMDGHQWWQSSFHKSDTFHTNVRHLRYFRQQ